jgi:DNA invertase Pin-like site-specific DNA recombinase
MTKTPAGKRYGAYHRVSDANGRDPEAETTMTDKDAFEQMDAWAKLRGVTIVERYLDWDQKGSTMERPELDRMLADLDAGVIDGIVVVQVDRLSRAEVGDALTVIKRIAGDDEQHPRPLVLLDLGIDPSTEFGEFGLTILLGLARMQWRRYKRQWSTAQTRAVKRGVWIGPAPVGYRKTGHGALEFDPATWKTVRAAFKIAAGDGMHAAMAYLERELPGNRWRKSDARRLLSNRAYLGEHHAGGAGHDPITNIADFEAAQTAPQARRGNGDYLLSGVATCKACGGPLVGAMQTVDGRSYRRYRCSDTCKGGVGSISADRLEGFVRERVAERLSNRKFRRLIEPVGEEQAEQALAVAESDLDAFQVATAGLPVDAIRRGIEARMTAVEAAREELRAVAETSARRERIPAASELDDPEQLLRAVRAMVISITVSGGRGRVEHRVGVVFVGDDLDDRAGVFAA